MAFTGAGISTESGIPDFRSPGGIWDRYAPIQYQEFLHSAEARRETWRRALHTYPVVAAARPNVAHLALKRLDSMGRLLGVVTQNIDGLHLSAGHSIESVIELHGNAHSVRCLGCGALSARTDVHDRVRRGEVEPRCDRCGGTLKPTTVSFGEPMPTEPMSRAADLARECDLMLVIGSSLVVHPAASIPLLASRSGAVLAIINATSTPLDSLAAVVVAGNAAEVLPWAVDQLGTGA